MDVHFEVVFVPLPKEREAEWREAMRIIAEMIWEEVVKTPPPAPPHLSTNGEGNGRS